MFEHICDQEIYLELKDAGYDVEPCGSRITCNPIPADADYDYLVYCASGNPMSKLVDFITTRGFDLEGGEHYQQQAENTFASWRNGNINLIVTSNQKFKDDHNFATKLSKKLNLMDKNDRIALFQAVLYGNFDWKPK